MYYTKCVRGSKTLLFTEANLQTGHYSKHSVGTDSGTTRFGHSVGPAHRRWNGGTNGKQIPTVRVLCWDNFLLTPRK